MIPCSMPSGVALLRYLRLAGAQDSKMGTRLYRSTASDISVTPILQQAWQDAGSRLEYDDCIQDTGNVGVVPTNTTLPRVLY